MRLLQSLAVLVILLLVGAAVWLRRPASRDYHGAPAESRPPGPELLAPVADVVGRALAGQPFAAQTALEKPGTALVLAYSQGKLISRVELPGPTWERGLDRAARLTARQLSSGRPDALYVGLGYDFQRCHYRRTREFPQGLIGLEWEGRAFYPLEAVTGSAGFETWLRSVRPRLKTTPGYEFKAFHCLLKPTPGGGWQALEVRRGRVAIAPRPDEAMLKEIESGLREALLRRASAAYFYIPNQDKELNEGSVPFHPLLIGWALAELHLRKPPNNPKPAAELGPAALTWLAQQAFGAPEGEAEMERILHGLWLPDGHFRSKNPLPERDYRHSHYPGMALLALARRHAGQDARYWQSFRVYLDEFSLNHAPALVPWLTMAYRASPPAPGSRELESSIFDMNDELLRYMQPARVPEPDLEGSFFTLGNHPLFGAEQSPQAFSTGLYLAGLADAYSLARERKQDQRAKAYRQAIMRGVGALRMAQYWNEDDMLFLPPSVRVKVKGALRMSPTKPRLRAGDEALPLLACVRLLQVLYQP